MKKEGLLALLLLSAAQLFFALRRAPSSKAHYISAHHSSLQATGADYSGYALLFDCDGVIVETEELHRIAYNKAFKKFGLLLPSGEEVEWNPSYYDELQNTVGGGKPKMKHYFTKHVKAWPICQTPYRARPTTAKAQTALIDDLQDMKTVFYKQIIEEVATARPGVLELMDAAIANPTLKVGICSAATKEGFVKLVDAVVGPERLSKLDVVIAGDDVSEKKPHPMIYDTARERLGGIPAENCVVVEDSLVGLRAAKGANMRCIITYTSSTEREDFYGEGADAKICNLGGVTLADIFDDAGILAGKRDPTSSTTTTTTITSTDGGDALPAEEVVGVVERTFAGWTPHYLLSGR
eukprot:gene25761-34342_t